MNGRGGLIECVMLRIAISVWHGRVSPVFDEANSLLVTSFGQDRIVRRELYLLGTGSMSRIRQLQGLNVDVLVCDAVTRELSSVLEASGIRVLSQVSGPADDAIEAYVDSIRAQGA